MTQTFATMLVLPDKREIQPPHNHVAPVAMPEGGSYAFLTVGLLMVTIAMILRKRLAAQRDAA